jgi:effector-binding domain-containing protein
MRGMVLAAALALAAPPAFGQAPPPDPMDEASADASNALSVVLEPAPVLLLQSNALWDDNFVTLQESFAALSKEAAALGIKIKGYPLAVYLDTDDAGFSFQAMLVIDGAAPSRPPLDPRIRYGAAPSGPALRFAHQGAFDELDSMYEAVTGYLDEKQLTMRTPYIEEYVSPLGSPADPQLMLNIYVLIDESKPAPSGPGVPAAPETGTQSPDSTPPALTVPAPPDLPAPALPQPPAPPLVPVPANPATPVPQPAPSAG